MSLSDLEQHMLAYFIAEHADSFNFADRFYPYGELTMIWDDKVGVAVRKFGTKARMKSKSVATALVDMLIEKGAYSTKKNDFGGTMHAFQLDDFRRIIREIKETDPIIQKAASDGPEFWEKTLSELTGA